MGAGSNKVPLVPDRAAIVTGASRGIGLALTRLVCQSRGGEVRLASTPEGGASFVAELGIAPVAGAVR